MIRTRVDREADQVRRRVCHDYGIELPYDHEEKIQSAFDAMPFPPWLVMAFYLFAIGAQFFIGFRDPNSIEFINVVVMTVMGFMMTWVIARGTYQHLQIRQRQRDNLVILELANRLERVNNDDSRGLALAVTARALHRNMRLDTDQSGDTRAMVDVELAAKLKQEVDAYLRGELEED